MDLQLRVDKILEPNYYNKKDGSQGVRYMFVGVTTESSYPRTVAFEVMNPEVWSKMNLQVGATYAIGFDIESREWNGKYFTTAKAFRAYPVGTQQQAPAQGQQQAPAPNTMQAPPQPLNEAPF